MKLYNTLSRKSEDFKPIHQELVRMYSCGPTVYDHIHIGNHSAFVYADTLRRAIEATNHKVRHVMNITDVDDKTIQRSAKNYPDDSPEEALSKLTQEYTDIFMTDMAAIGNNIEAVEFINATANIEGMRALIKELHDDGFAYIAEDGVYFSIDKYKASGRKYGQLTDINSADTSNARIANDEYDKESAHDFALWKISKLGEPSWPFKLNKHDLDGRPGWHIECSVMSVQTLGQPFDIHTGGVDLKFPHHENEIAQSTAAASPTLANIFFHNEHLLVDGKKMSKSLGNFFTLQDIKEKGYDPLAFRLMVLQSHYRNQSNFTWENLEAAQNRLRDYQAMAALRWQTVNHNHDSTTIVLKDVPAELVNIMQNDLDTPTVLAYLSKIASQLEVILIDRDASNRYNNLDDFTTMLETIDSLLGLDLTSIEDISDTQKDLIIDREKNRKEKDWAKSDKIRKQLEDQGIGLRDTEHGAIWFRL